MNQFSENTLRIRRSLVLSKAYPYGRFKQEAVYVPRNAKLLAWGIFLMFFIENGTLGLLPPSMYFVYRNMRISDFIMYGLIVYSLFNLKEYADVIKGNVILIPKILLWYYIIQFIASVFVYQTNVIEYFFRLKLLWGSFLIFPYLLLLKRGGLDYLIKIFFPFAVVSNILYILTAITGVQFLPEASIVRQVLPGGTEVNRVFGSTFFGEHFFLGFVFLTLIRKFNVFYLVFGTLFLIPHILALGRGAWVNLALTVLFIFIWHILKTKNVKSVIREVALVSVVSAAIVIAFIRFMPEPEFYWEVLNLRVLQGTEDYRYSEGTYGTRMENNKALIDLWLNSNFLFGVGMSPFWIVKPETSQEALYLWGFADLRWAAVLAAYGIVGFLLAVAFQIFYLFNTIKILRKDKHPDIYSFFIILFCGMMFFDTFVNFTINFISIGIYGLPTMLTFYIAIFTYKHYTQKKLEEEVK